MIEDLVFWLIIYLALGLLIYLTYYYALGRYDYQSKSNPDEQVALFNNISLSMILFGLSGVAVVYRYRGVAIWLLLISILLDSVNAARIGVTVPSPPSVALSEGLTYITISPIIYKAILYGYIQWVGGLAQCSMTDPIINYSRTYLNR